MAAWKLKLPSSYYRYKKKASHKLSAATRAKISAALRGRPHPHKGHPLSLATRAKISAALKAKPHVGHPLSAATKAKISAALKARHLARPITAAARSAPAQAKVNSARSAALSARDRMLAKLHISIASAHKPRVFASWKNPIRRARYRLVTADVHRRRLGLLRTRRLRHHGPILHTRIRYHRVWHRRRRR